MCGRRFCYTVRERTMIALMNELTDTHDWHRKIFDSEYTFKWKSALVMSGRDITRSMADWVRYIPRYVSSIRCLREPVCGRGKVLCTRISHFVNRACNRWWYLQVWHTSVFFRSCRASESYRFPSSKQADEHQQWHSRRRRRSISVRLGVWQDENNRPDRLQSFRLYQTSWRS